MDKFALEVNDRGFAYLEYSSGSHGHVKTRIWVHASLTCKGREKQESVYAPDGKTWERYRGTGEFEPALEMPRLNARVEKTEKGSLVMRPCPGSVVYSATIRSGYRGSASIDKVEGGEIMAYGHTYHSGQGALGCTAWAVINGWGPVEVYGSRSGRRVADGDVAFRLTPDGEEKELIQDKEVCDLLS